MPKGRMVTNEEHEAMRAAYDAGESRSDIAKRMGLAYVTVRRHTADILPGRRAEAQATMPTVHVDAPQVEATA